MSGLTDEGFEKPTRADILDEIETDQRDNISVALNQSTQSPLGQLNGIFADHMSQCWDALEAAHQARRPDGATGSSLTQLCLVTGTDRDPATPSRGTVTVNLDDGFSALAGTMFAHVTGDPDKRATNRDLVENSSGITDDFDVEFEAVTAGATAFPSGSLEVIAEPLTGWNSIANAEDFDVGTDDETNEALRQKREDELQASGSTTADAIRSDILDQLSENITHCRVLVNDTDATDGSGLPPKSFEVIVRGLAQTDDDADAVAAVILASKPTGIQAYSSGGVYRTVEDSQGNSYVIGLTWVEEIPIFVDIGATIDLESFPDDGDDQIKAAVVALEVEPGYKPGLNAVADRIRAIIFRDVPGILEIPTAEISTSMTPTVETTIPISIRQIATFDTANIVVVSSDGTP